VNRAWHAALAAAAVAGASRNAAHRYPEALAECSRSRVSEARAAVTHLGGCKRRTLRVKGLVGGLGEAGPGWSLVLVTDRGIERLRRRGCPTAVVCTSGNELAALQQSLGPDALARMLDEVKARARPALRAGVDGGPTVPWD
jgi:hypothetical protein